MERSYFLGGNTPQGFVSFYGDIVDNYKLKKFYILKGGSGLGKSTFMKKFAERILEKFPTTDVDYVYCSQEPTSLDAVIFPVLGVGVMDGTNPHMVDPKYPGIVDAIVDLGKHIDEGKIKPHFAELKQIIATKKMHYKEAYKHLALAKSEHDKVENAYVECVGWAGVDADFERVVGEVMGVI